MTFVIQFFHRCKVTTGITSRVICRKFSSCNLWSLKNKIILLHVNNVHEKSLGITAQLRVLYSDEARSLNQWQRALDPNFVIIDHSSRQQVGHLPRPKFIPHNLGRFLLFCYRSPKNLLNYRHRLNFSLYSSFFVLHSHSPINCSLSPFLCSLFSVLYSLLPFSFSLFPFSFSLFPFSFFLFPFSLFPFPIPRSPLPVPYFLFPVFCSLFSVPCSLPSAPCSLLPVLYFSSLFSIPCSPFFVFCSLFPVPCSLFFTLCSLFLAFCYIFPVPRSLIMSLNCAITLKLQSQCLTCLRLFLWQKRNPANLYKRWSESRQSDRNDESGAKW